MKIQNIIQTLIQKGHTVLWYTRPDGGIRVTMIDQNKYSTSNAKGNNRAREIAGVSMTNAQVFQRVKAGALSKVGHKVSEKKPQLTKIEKKKLAKLNAKTRELNKKLNKTGKAATPRVGRQEAREFKGREKNIKDLFDKMKRNIRHSLDIAYAGNVRWFLAHLEKDDVFPRTQSFLRSPANISRISDRALSQCHQIYYNFKTGKVPESVADSECLDLLKTGKQVIESVIKIINLK